MGNNILTIIITGLSSSFLTTLVTLLLGKRKTEAEAKKVNTESDMTVLNAQHELLEKLLKKSQELVEQNEKLQQDYGEMVIENAKLRADIVYHLATISNLQKDTKAMRQEVQAIMGRVKEIDEYLSKISEAASTPSQPFPKDDIKI
ncbi:MAG TPA: hypothetical protein PLP33_24850 [Leptospiraceae bacterium]|nr:hypothetical protein [Leptospiraceae bacterium]